MDVAAMGDHRKVEAECIYAAYSSNRNENNLSCRAEYLLYSKFRCPIIYDTQSCEPVACLAGHTDEVNGQSFVDDDDQTENAGEQSLHVISTAHDKTSIIWRLIEPLRAKTISNSEKYEIIHRIESPDGSVFQTRCSRRLADGNFISVLTTIEGNLYLFENNQLVQSLATRICYFDVKFHSIIHRDSNSRDRLIQIVSLAGSDNRVHIYLLDERRQLVSLLDLAGFNDWIKCLDFLPLAGRQNESLLAAACQDSLIQVWHLRLTHLSPDEMTRVRTNVSKPVHFDGQELDLRLTATLETVLSGHESFVHSLCWFKRKCGEDSNLLQLISCSSDRTLNIWQSTIAKNAQSAIHKYEQYPASEGVWKQLAQLGETGETFLPFLGVCLSQDERTIFGQTYRGAIHRWTLMASNQSSWEPKHSITGHFDAITDIVWSNDWVLSASLDKTCRLHAVAQEDSKWHELARPQVHGFEVNCLAPLSGVKFASGAEEKTIRTFEATQFFVNSFERLTSVKLLADEPSKLSELPAHAQLPALGLSNRGAQLAREDDQSNGPQGDKALMLQSNSSSSWDEAGAFARRLAALNHLEALPNEEVLMQSTLWWEKNKLFGHCNELFALASSPDGKFLASASKANRPDLANVLIWDTDRFRKVTSLEHHSLTITRLRFSPDSAHLLSVSRDRTWCLFERQPGTQLRNAYRKLTGTVKSSAVHERIIWDCAWTWDSRYFCTVSRDKRALVWSLEQLRGDSTADQASPTPVTSHTSDCSIQAIDSPATMMADQLYLFALGFEDGSLELHSMVAFEWRLMRRFEFHHQLTIRRLAFKPTVEHNGLLLASGGDDCVLKLTRLKLHVDD